MGRRTARAGTIPRRDEPRAASHRWGCAVSTPGPGAAKDLRLLDLSGYPQGPSKVQSGEAHGRPWIELGLHPERPAGALVETRVDRRASEADERYRRHQDCTGGRLSG